MRDGVPEPLRADDPREVSGYVLRSRVGEGGMGTVYLSHTRGGQPVALKVIRREHSENPAFRVRFAREVAAARRVSGYHLAQVVDHSAEGPLPWLATQYVPGLPLDAALDAYGPLPMSAVLRLTGCLAGALDAVHAAGVIHRDVKPGNVLLAADGPWLLDFGIARATDTRTLTTMGRLVGSPKNMSPEHALGRQLTPASDVFALGLLAAEAATGQHPYGRGHGLAVAARIAGTDREPPRLDHHPEPLRRVIGLCLAARPEERPTAAAVAELCRQALDTGGGRGLRDFGGWLPAPVASAVARIETATRSRPSSSTPIYLPTVRDPSAGDRTWRIRRTTEPE
ncbi:MULTISPECIES: serine/threonine-protein kinase [unclassified Streptomyces]|uniref:serine/threonine-protein kinase n=1 Tax=unclassified Streptomyces TaxID=2593676 RepID=UPI0036E13DED